jgi:hypothetical protein
MRINTGGKYVVHRMYRKERILYPAGERRTGRRTE